MYSDNDDESTYYLDSSSIGSDADDGTRAAERFVEDNEPTTYHRLYNALFEFTDCPFQKAVPKCYHTKAPRKGRLRHENLTHLLPYTTFAQSCAVTEAPDGAEITPSAAVGESPQEAESAANGRREEQERPPRVATADQIDCEDGSYYAPKANRVSRFLADNLSQCVVFPIPTDVNRAVLKEMHAHDEVALPELHVGYRGRDPAGWALPLTTDPAVIAHFQSHYRECRAATDADVNLFAKWVHVTDGAPQKTRTTQQTGTTAVQAPPSLSKAIAQHNHSTSKLLDTVAAAGGWDAVTFVAVDVEAFATLKGGEPLPAEVQLLPCETSGKDRRRVTAHFFVHPGQVSLEALQNVEYTSTQVHFIPYQHATFLRTDYAALAKHIDDSARTRKDVILINKGSVMDVAALLWIYAASALDSRRREAKAPSAEEGDDEEAELLRNPLAVPTLDELACFDISTLKAALEQVFPLDEATAAAQREEQRAAQKSRRVRACHYHRAIKREIVAQQFLYDDLNVHCAYRDAAHLAQDVVSLLRLHGVGGAK